MQIVVEATHAAPLRFLIEPRGISVIASLENTAARSPVDRFGVISLVHDARAGDIVTLTVESRDSPDVSGEACVSVAELSTTDEERLEAERAFAAAGVALQAEKTQQSFQDYLEAARAFDALDPVRAAQARHAMAEIAYGKISREDDAYWLARSARDGFGGHASAGLKSTLYTLEARTLLESDRLAPAERHEQVFGLLEKAQRFAEQDPFGARELPRLDILRGFMEYRAGDTTAATRAFTRAADRCEALKDWECYARALQNSASLAEEARNFTVALKAYADALRTLPPHLDPQLTADIWGNQGRLQGRAGFFQQSEKSHRVSIRYHADIGDCEGARVGVARLGALLVQVGGIGEGRDYLARAASLDCAHLLASVNESSPPAMGKEAGFCKDLLPIESLGPSGKLAVFNALLGLREALTLNDQAPAAERCLAAAETYAVTARTRLRLVNAQGNAQIMHGDAKGAAATFRRAIDLADRAGLPPTNEHRSLTYLGLARAALATGQPAMAREYANRSLSLGSARADVEQVVDSLQLLARSFSADEHVERAIGVLSTAASLVEQVPIDDLDADKRATWLATQHSVFTELTTLFATLAGKSEAALRMAFDTSERGRARSIRYALNQAMASRPDETREPSSAHYRTLMQRIAELARPAADGSNASISIDALANAVESGNAGRQIPASDLLQKRLAKLGATTVEYAAGREDMYAFVVDEEHISITRLGKRMEIADAAARLYDQLRNPEAARADLQRAAAKLASLVLWPIATRLTRDRIILVPDDSLHTVPFGVLPLTAQDDPQLLIESAEVSVIPSTLFVTNAPESPQNHARNMRFELIGDPVFREVEWQRTCAVRKPAEKSTGRDASGSESVNPAATMALPRLAGSRREVLAIAKLARQASPPHEVSTRLGCDATPSALRAAAAASPELLHIATHGYVDAFRPRLSALALTPDLPSDGGASTIGLLDILDMRLGSRLVVLSACDTSRGRLLPGEGVLGPAQAFLQAGATSVVASYWRIPDERTAPFMQSFYRYLLVDRLSAAAALRKTQLDFAKNRTSHDWAAFTLYGWPDTML